MSYLNTSTSQSTTVAYQPETPPPYHSRSGSQSNTNSNSAPFFSKLKGISRSKSPIDPLYLSYAEPQSPASSSSTRSSDPTTPVSPAFKKSVLLKKQLQRSPGNLDEEFDPTTLRKNRPSRRKNPEDIYHAYDDLFEDSSDESSEIDIPTTTTMEFTESSDEFNYDGLRRSKLGNPTTSRTPPRCVPSPLHNKYVSGSPGDSSPSLRWRRMSETATPPHSKPSSIVDYPLSPSQDLYTLPPTPPPKSVSPFLEQASSDISGKRNSSSLQNGFLSTLDTTEFELAVLPHSTQPKKGSIKRKEGKQSSDVETLGIAITQRPTSYSSGYPSPARSWVGSSGSFSESALDKAYRDDITKRVSMLLDTPADLGVLPLFSNKAQPIEASKTTGNNVTSAKHSGYRIPRKEVRSSVPVENPLEDLMTETKNISTRDGSTGYTPQMRITDVQDDLDDIFQYASFDESPLPSPLPSRAPSPSPSASNFDTMKEVVSFTSGPIEVDGQSAATRARTPSESSKGTESEESSKEGEKKAAPDTTHLRVFRQFLKNSGENDAFIHRYPRFDALQAQRICTHLREDSPLVPSKQPSKETVAEVASKPSKLIRQREVGDQLQTSMWALMAFRWMMFGKVILSPAHEHLAAASAKRLGKRLATGRPKSAERPDGEKTRVLDLGGLPVGDWGWHCAYDYPKTKVYTVTARPYTPTASPAPESEIPDTPVSDSKTRGPKNHRHVTVAYLWRLPFPDNHFDVVSARSLYSSLKVHRQSPAGSPLAEHYSPLSIMDEYDLCLEECLRVLKPGGYLDYFVIDSDLIKSGPLGAELSSKFAQDLQANGYDPTPTKKWIQRLNKAGFGDMKRAWVYVPMAPQVKPKPPAKDNYDHTLPPTHQRNLSAESFDPVKEEVRRKMEAWVDPGVVNGTTENAAAVSGLLGSWVWEKWMLKTRQEAKGEGKWELDFDTIGAVLEEGKERGSGWRAIVGWARKPLLAPAQQYANRRAAGRQRADSGESVFGF